VTLRRFIVVNGWSWSPYPGIDEAEQAVLAVASSAWDELKTAEWLRGRLEPPVCRHHTERRFPQLQEPPMFDGQSRESVAT